MFLQEEYFNRHGITGVPIINHMSNGSLLLRNNEGPLVWMLMVITWKDPHNHPGKYYINFLSPVHDALNCGYRFFVKRLENDVEVEWDYFQNYILGWSKESKATAILGDLEVALATWEVFSYCIDSWLAKEADGNFRKLHYVSVDLDLSLRERYIGYQAALAYLTDTYPSVYKSFRDDFKCHFHSYCHWLGKLVQSQHEVLLKS